MTPTLKEQLEQWIERESKKQKIYQPKYGGKDHSGYETLMKYEVNYERVECYQAGAHSILPMLIVAVHAMDEYHDLHYAPKLEEAINKIKSMMKGSGNG